MSEALPPDPPLLGVTYTRRIKNSRGEPGVWAVFDQRGPSRGSWPLTESEVLFFADASEDCDRWIAQADADRVAALVLARRFSYRLALLSNQMLDALMTARCALLRLEHGGDASEMEAALACVGAAIDEAEGRAS